MKNIVFASNLFTWYVSFFLILFHFNLNSQQLSLRQLTFSDTTHDGYPYWSPDGKWIAFSSTRTDYWAIWVMEIDLEFIHNKLELTY